MKKKLLWSIFIVLIIFGLLGCFVGIKHDRDTKIQESILSGSQEGEENLEQGFKEEPEEIISGVTKTAEDDGFQLGPKQDSIIYFSQIDNRWKNDMYSNHNDSSQTIGSSGCGPTSAAMVVSGIKGLVYPNQMGDLYVKYGYRSYNDGTYLSAFQFTADYFGMEFTRVYNVNASLEKLKDNHYVIVSCSNGLFTTGGHFIVLWKYEDLNNNGVIDNPDIVHVYDPYLYNNKFNILNRAGKVELVGNDAQVSVYNFINYANTKGWFCFKHNNQDVVPTPTPTPTPTPQPDPVKPTDEDTLIDTGVVSVNTALNVRRGPGTNYGVIRTLSNGTRVDIYEKSNGWDRIGQGEWVSGKYVITGSVTPPTTNTVGQTRKLKATTTLYSNSDLTGTRYTYLANTTVKILKNVNANVDYIYVPQTGRYAYVEVVAYKDGNPATPATTNTVGQYKYFKKTYTYIYKNSSMKGTYYSYLANTKVKILKNVTTNIDYIYVVKTGRYGYVNTSVYK